MEIAGLEGMTAEQLNDQLARGGRFIVYQYTISIIILTFYRSSGIRFVRAGASSFAGGIGYTLVSLLFGWWGIPWGPIRTIQGVVANLRGGRDVTAEVVEALNAG